MSIVCLAPHRPHHLVSRGLRHEHLVPICNQNHTIPPTGNAYRQLLACIAAAIAMTGSLDAVRQLASRVLLLNHDFSSSPAHHAADATPSASLPLFSSSIGAMWALVGLLIGMGLALLSVWQRHRRARRLLEGGQCNLPTVLWRPRFVNYAPDQEDEHEDDEALMKTIQHSNQGKSQQKMASSSITNMLPRMERLGGSYGMYGTIYGLSTRVVHVGHPLPAKTILSGLGSSASTGGGSIGGSIRHRQATSARINQKRRSTFISSSGATKAPAYDHFKNFSGDGVFTADGDDWKAKRASVIHCLLRGCTGDKSDGMRRLEREANLAVDGFIENIERERKMRRRAGQCNYSEVEEADICLNVVPILQKSTIGLIYRFITHHDIALCRAGIEEDGIVHDEASDSNSLATTTPKSSSTSLCSLSEEESPRPLGNENGGNEFYAKTPNKATENHTNTSSVPMRLLGSYLKSVTHIRMIILAQSRSFWFLVPRWIYRVFSPMYRAEEKTMGPIREFARAACLNAQPGSPLALLQSRPSHGSGNNARKSSRNSTDVSKAMLDEAITLLFAGQDTSAATLSWTLHLLSLYPEVQEKLAKEVAASLKKQQNSNDDGDAQFFTKQFASNMPYLDAVIKESMRLYPVAPFVVRKLPLDVTIPAETKSAAPTILPEGSLACVWIYALHRNPRLWHRPDDFVPERWIDPNLKDLDEGQCSGAFMPFANGPRNCVGQPLAHVILRIILARIVDRYKVVDKRLGNAGGSAVPVVSAAMDLRKDMQAGFTVLPSGGVRLSLQRRRRTTTKED